MPISILRNRDGSVSLPIPKKVLALAKMSAGSEVEIEVKAGSIVISPVQGRSFADLLAEHRKLKLPRDDAWLDSAT
ncbi:MAG: hypothetical protein A3H35_07605 [Betaproteobacteria bacterium RIFCSPLOWO2_02_FULL_62_17]|nr:MAG: hypothetical protein A3H35_07605 [Betaproteobacteria bacterium RIFCSPLOWO2_02_FULL_62_17]